MRTFIFLAAAAGCLAIGGFVYLRGQNIDVGSFATAQYDETMRGLTGGSSAFFNSGVPLCESEFATHLVRDAIDSSALVTESPTQAKSTDLIEVSNVSLDKNRVCRGTVVFKDGGKVAVNYTIVPRGFHNFLVKASATAPASPPPTHPVTAIKPVSNTKR